MSRRPFDPRELGELPGDDPVIRELENYSGLTAGEQPHGLTDRIMAAVAEEPAPRRGLLAGLLGNLEAGRGGNMMRMAMVTATMALAVLAVVLASQLGELFREPQIGPSPFPSVVDSTVPSATESPSPSPTPSESPSARPSRTPRPTDDESPEATESPDDDDNSGPGGGGDDGTETPEPTDDDNSGPGGGGGDDDNSGPGGGGDDDDNSGPGGGGSA